MNQEEREQHCKFRGHVWGWKESELCYSITRTCANCQRMEKSNSITGWTVLPSKAEELAQEMSDAFLSGFKLKNSDST